MVWGAVWVMLTLSGGAWEGFLVGLNPSEDRKALGMTWVCLLFYHSPIPRPQCGKRLSFLGFQDFLSERSFSLCYFCYRPNQKHSVTQLWNSHTPVTAQEQLNESGCHGLAYGLIIEKKIALDLWKTGRRCCCTWTENPCLCNLCSHENRKSAWLWTCLSKGNNASSL